MNKNRFTLLIYLFLLSLTGFAQSGADPAVTNRDLQPAPLTGIGSPFSITFTIGNNGTAPISGTGVADQMQFKVCLGKCAPVTADGLSSLSGPIADTYFDITWNGTCFQAVQKLNVVLGATNLYNLEIAAVVTGLSSATVTNDVGASCTIVSNSSAKGQPTDNDFASIYTHTTNVPQPVALVSFTAQAQPDRTVLLNWSTSWEQANKSYTVERSKDMVNFERVGEVTDVAGNSKSITRYQLKDPTPYRGTSYYRLRQTDQSGRFHEYPLAGVVVRDEAYGVYPNPIQNGRLTLALDEPQTALVQLYTATGQPVTFQKKMLDESHLELRSERSLSAGIYVLRVEERGQKRQYRVVVSE